MNATPWIDAAGWTLAHFLWQGVIVALVLAGLLRGIRSAQARYAAATGALALLLIAAVGTFAWLFFEASDRSRPSLPSPVVGVSSSGEPWPEREAGPLLTQQSTVEIVPNPPAWPQPVSALHRVDSTDQATSSRFPWQSWAVALWLFGVAVFGLRFALDWRATQSLRKNAHPLTGPKAALWGERFARLKHRLGMSRPVVLLASATARIPVALGVLRPVIIVPVAMLSQLSPAQVEAILLHELFHVRRHDYLVNLLQTLAEVLFFFHPAVWWISKRMRAERENCCDDLAASHCDNVRDYVGALAALEESRANAQADPALGIAADGGRRGGLLHRIRRLAWDDAPIDRSNPGWLSVLLGTIAVAGMIFIAFAMITRAEEHDDKGKWNRLKVSHFGDTKRELLCMHTGDDIQAVVVVEHPDFFHSGSSEAGVRRQNGKAFRYHAYGTFRWDEQRLRIEFDSHRPGQIRLNDQLLRLQNGRVIFWRQAEAWADQSTVLAADLPQTKSLAELRRRIIETFAPETGDPVLAPRKPGNWDLGDGISLSVEAGFKASTNAVIRWSASEKWPALRHEIPLAGDGFGQDGRWTLALEKGTRILWVAHPENHAQVDFSDPEQIRIDRLNSAFGNMPGGIRAEMQRYFRLDKRLDKAGIPYIGGNIGGESILTASIDKEFVIRGTVLDLRNPPPQPLAGVLVEAFLLTDDPVTSAVSDVNGAWELRFRLRLGSMANGKWLEVRTNLPGMMDRDLFGEAEFALSPKGEPYQSKPAHVRTLTPGEPIKDITFRLLKAGKIAGALHDAQGKPIPDAYVTVKVDDAERNPPDGAMRRDGKSVRGMRTDAEGKFQLTNIPPNRKLHLTATKRGQVVQAEAYEFGDSEYAVDLTWSDEDMLICNFRKETRKKADVAATSDSDDDALAQSWIDDVFQLEDEARKQAALSEIRDALASGTDARIETGLRAFTQLGDVQFDKPSFHDLFPPLLSSSNKTLRALASRALVISGPRGNDLDRLIAMVDDPERSVRKAAAPQIVKAAKSDLTGKAGEAIQKLLQEEDVRFQRAVLHPLWGAKFSPRLEAQIIRLSRHPVRELASDALYYALSTQANKSEATVKRLIEFFAHQDTVNIAGRAAWGLGQGVAESEHHLVAKAALNVMNTRQPGSYLFKQAVNRLEQYAGYYQRTGIETFLAKPGITEALHKRLERVLAGLSATIPLPEEISVSANGHRAISYHRDSKPVLLILSDSFIQTGLSTTEYGPENGNKWKIEGFINLIRNKEKLRTFQVRWTSDEPDIFYLDQTPYRIEKTGKPRPEKSGSAIGTIVLRADDNPLGVDHWMKITNQDQLNKIQAILAGPGSNTELRERIKKFSAWSTEPGQTQAIEANHASHNQPILIRLTSEGKIPVRSEILTPEDYLRNHGLDDSDPDRPVVISVPPNTPYHLVVATLNLFKRSTNLRNISIVSEEEMNEMTTSHPQDIIVTISKEGTITVGDEEVKDGNALIAHLKNIAEKNQNPALPIILRAPQDTPFQHVRAVLNAIKRAGFSNIVFATAKTEATTEQEAPAVAGSHKSTWSAQGRVTDPDGKPLAEVEISVHAGHGSLRRTGFTKTGADGRYQVNFSRGMLSPADSPNLQVAQITAHVPGHVEKNLNRHGNGAMALHDVPEEDLKGWGIKKETGLALPGKPRNVDFVMVPAVRIEGQLVGTGAFSGVKPEIARRMNPDLPRGPYTELRQSPLKGWRVWITGEELPPGCSIWDEATTDEEGNFVFENVPAGFTWHFETDTNIPKHKRPVSREFTFAPGVVGQTSSVTLELEADQKNVRLKFSKETPEKSDPAATPAKATEDDIPRENRNRFQPRPWSDEKHAKLPFGPANDDGLRVARFFDPREDVYEIGAKVEGRIVFHNAGKAPVEFLTEHWHQRDKWHSRDADGRAVRIEEYESTGFLGNFPMPYRLEPGQVCEVDAQGAAIGTVPYEHEPGENYVYWTSKLPGAKPGDAITCAWDVTYTPKGTDTETTLRSGDFTFKVKARPADFPVDLGIARHLGKYHLAKGVMLQLSRSPAKTTATIKWDDGQQHKLALEHHDRGPIGLITWWRGGDAFWIAGEKQLRKIDFADPDNVSETKWVWDKVHEDFGGAPELVWAKIREHRRKSGPDKPLNDRRLKRSGHGRNEQRFPLMPEKNNPNKRIEQVGKFVVHVQQVENKLRAIAAAIDDPEGLQEEQQSKVYDPYEARQKFVELVRTLNIEDADRWEKSFLELFEEYRRVEQQKKIVIQSATRLSDDESLASKDKPLDKDSLRSILDKTERLVSELDAVSTQIAEWAPFTHLQTKYLQAGEILEKVAGNLPETIAADYRISWLRIPNRELDDVNAPDFGGSGSFEIGPWLPAGNGNVRANLATRTGFISVLDSHPLQCSWNGKVGMIYVPPLDDYGGHPHEGHATIVTEYPEAMARNGMGYCDWVVYPFSARWESSWISPSTGLRSLGDVLIAIKTGPGRPSSSALATAAYRNTRVRPPKYHQETPRLWFRVLEDTAKQLRFGVVDQAEVFHHRDQERADLKGQILVEYVRRRYEVTLSKILNYAMTELVEYDVFYDNAGLEHPDSSIKKKTYFSDHVEFDGIWLPKRISWFTKPDEALLKREVIVNHLNANDEEAMVDEITVPAGIKVFDEREPEPEKSHEEEIENDRESHSASTDSPKTNRNDMAQKYQLHIDGFEFGADAEGNYLKLDLRNDQPHIYTIAETQMETGGLFGRRHIQPVEINPNSSRSVRFSAYDFGDAAFWMYGSRDTTKAKKNRFLGMFSAGWAPENFPWKAAGNYFSAKRPDRPDVLRELTETLIEAKHAVLEGMSNWALWPATIAPADAEGWKYYVVVHRENSTLRAGPFLRVKGNSIQRFYTGPSKLKDPHDWYDFSETSARDQVSAVGYAKTITNPAELRAHIESLIASRNAIRSAELDLTLNGTNRTYGSRNARYQWKLDHDKFRSDRTDLPFVAGISYRETLIYSDDHQIRFLPNKNNLDYTSAKHRGTNPIFDARHAGLVDWFLESIDTCDPMTRLMPESASDWRFSAPDKHTIETVCDYGKERGSGVHRVRFDRRCGLHPTFIRTEWTDTGDKEVSYTTTLEIEPKHHGNGIWFPAKTVFHRVLGTGKEDFREIMTVRRARFNHEIDPILFTVEGLNPDKDPAKISSEQAVPSYLGRDVDEWNAMLAKIRGKDREALRSLGFGSSDAVPDEAIPMILALIESGEFATRCRCLGILRKLKNPSDPVLETVLDVIRQDKGGNAFRAGWVLGYFPDRTDYTVPRLINMLEERGPNLEAAVHALDSIGPVARDAALPALKALYPEAGELSGKVEKAINSMHGHHTPAAEETGESQTNLFLPDPTIFSHRSRLQELANRVSLGSIQWIAADYQVIHGDGKATEMEKIDRSFLTAPREPIYPARLRLDRKTGNGFYSGKSSYAFQRARNNTVGKSLIYLDDEDQYRGVLYSPGDVTIVGQYAGYDKWVTNPFHNNRTLEDVLRGLIRGHQFLSQDSPKIWFRIVEDSDFLFRFDIVDHIAVAKSGDEISEEERARGVSASWDVNVDRFQVTLDKRLNWAMTELLRYGCNYDQMGLEHSPRQINSRIFYSDHVRFGNIWLPKNIRSVTGYKTRTSSIELAVTHLSVNEPDDMIDTLEFPNGARVSDEKE